MSGIEEMVSRAEKSLGIGEPNYIHTWYNAKFGNLGSNWPWCNAAVTYWAWHSGNQDTVTFGGGYAYTVAHAQKFNSKGKWHYGSAGIRRGDIVFFDWAGRDSISAIDHVGLVTGVRSDGKVLTIEGNTSNVCARRVRGAYEIAGYGRPAYASSSPAPAPSGKPWVWEHGPWKSAYVTNTARIVQKALKAEYPSAGVEVDGRFDLDTKTVYARWQRSLGYTGSDADGIPGSVSLRKLGAKHGFDVRRKA